MRFHMNNCDSDNDENTTKTTTSSDATSEAESNISSTEHIRKFVFSSSIQKNLTTNQEDQRTRNSIDRIEIRIPELLQGAYSFYTWPCAPILAYFLWERRQALVGKRILELGCGTALPGILAAKIGAQVVLSDNCILPKSHAHIRKSCLANNLTPGQDIDIIGLSWGLLLNSVFSLPPLDFIIAADCFYDPSVFEDIIVTVSFLLERNPQSKFLFTYQERSADWSIEALLKKWKLIAVPINIDEVGKSSDVDLLELMGGHTIHLLEVIRDI